MMQLHEMRDRRARYVKHRLGIEAEKHHQGGQWRHERYLARRQIRDRAQGRFVDHAEDDPAIEP